MAASIYSTHQKVVYEAVIGYTGSLCWLYARLIWKALSILVPGPTLE